MQFQELTINEHNLTALDSYMSLFSPSEFLQSSSWLKFQQALGHNVKLFQWKAEQESGYFLAIEIKLPLGRSYYYIPRGPITNDQTIWPKLLEELKKYFKSVSSAVVFIRLEPNSSFQNQIPRLKRGMTRRVVDIQPSCSFQTDVTKDEKELLAAMHQKTRYNIKIALKNNLLLSFDDPNHEEFFNLMRETAQRDKFKPHNTKYYQAMLDAKIVNLATVRDDKGLLAAGLFITFGKTMVYLHGASAARRREVMSPYALHWEMIMKAKADGLEIYDWHGVDEKKWPGVTRFKRGFGGREFIYPGTFDLVIDKMAYAGYTLMRGIRRLF